MLGGRRDGEASYPRLDIFPSYNSQEDTPPATTPRAQMPSITNNPDDSEMVVSLSPLVDRPDDDTCREIRVSCPDATGLGCDLAREMLNFGLNIIRGDFSTDGKWSFLIFEVRLSRGYKPYWDRLKRQIERCCPGEGSAGLRELQRYRKPSQLYVLQVTTIDSPGVLHKLVTTLWECDLMVHKAHITTNPGDQAIDMFWVTDNTDQLPALERMLRIRDQVKAVLGEDSSCVLEAAAECSADLDARAVRVACKDARAQDPLRLHKSRPGSLHGGSAAHLALTGAHGHGHGHVHVHHPTRPLHGHGGHGGLGRHRRNVSSEVAQELGLGPLEQVEMTVDNTMSSEHTVITLVVPDRKGLTYDIMRVLKDQEVRIAYGRIGPEGAEGGRTVIDLFLQQEFESRGICDQDLIDDLAETLRLAVAMPITVTIADVFDGACTQLTLRASVDSGGRGRPRVIADTTRAVAACHCGVFMADMFMEDVRDADPALPGCGSNRRVEIHRFLIHDELGRPLLAREQKQLLLARVKQEILGSGCEEDVRLAALAPSKSRVFSVASLDSLASSPGGFGSWLGMGAASTRALSIEGDTAEDLQHKRSRLGRDRGSDDGAEARSVPGEWGLPRWEHRWTARRQGGIAEVDESESEDGADGEGVGEGIEEGEEGDGVGAVGDEMHYPECMQSSGNEWLRGAKGPVEAMGGLSVALGGGEGMETWAAGPSPGPGGGDGEEEEEAEEARRGDWGREWRGVGANRAREAAWARGEEDEEVSSVDEDEVVVSRGGSGAERAVEGTAGVSKGGDVARKEEEEREGGGCEGEGAGGGMREQGGGEAGEGGEAGDTGEHGSREEEGGNGMVEGGTPVPGAGNEGCGEEMWRDGSDESSQAVEVVATERGCESEMMEGGVEVGNEREGVHSAGIKVDVRGGAETGGEGEGGCDVEIEVEMESPRCPVRVMG